MPVHSVLYQGEFLHVFDIEDLFIGKLDERDNCRAMKTAYQSVSIGKRNHLNFTHIPLMLTALQPPLLA